MPKMCGADVLNIASARFPNVGRVLLSGHSHSDLVRSDVDLGDVEIVLHKGIPLPEFQAAMWELVKKNREV
jgi:hypothetical protein